MKKRMIAVFACVAGFAWLNTMAGKKNKMKYDFPEAMSAEVRAGFTEICDKGKVLYDINCAKCHNMKVNGKETIPDFSPSELKGYELRVSNARHESNMDDTLVTAEELGMISTFLTYKPKSNIQIKRQNALK